MSDRLVRSSRNSDPQYAPQVTEDGDILPRPGPSTPSLFSAGTRTASLATPDLSFGTSSAPNTLSSSLARGVTGFGSRPPRSTSQSKHKQKRKQRDYEDADYEDSDGDVAMEDNSAMYHDGDAASVRFEEDGDEHMEDTNREEEDVFIEQSRKPAAKSSRKAKGTKAADKETFAIKQARFANFVAVNALAVTDLLPLSFVGLTPEEEKEACNAAWLKDLVYVSLNLGPVDNPSYLFLTWDYHRFDAKVILSSATIHLASDRSRHQQLLNKGRFYTDLLGAVHHAQNLAVEEREITQETKSSPPRTHSPHTLLKPTSPSQCRPKRVGDIAAHYGKPPSFSQDWLGKWDAEKAAERESDPARRLLAAVLSAKDSLAEQDPDSSLEVDKAPLSDSDEDEVFFNRMYDRVRNDKETAMDQDPDSSLSVKAGSVSDCENA